MRNSPTKGGTPWQHRDIIQIVYKMNMINEHDT